MVPVQAIVIRLYSSGVTPQLTNTAGSGYTMVPGFQLTFDMLVFSCKGKKSRGTPIEVIAGVTCLLQVLSCTDFKMIKLNPWVFPNLFRNLSAWNWWNDRGPLFPLPINISTTTIAPSTNQFIYSNQDSGSSPLLIFYFNWQNCPLIPLFFWFPSLNYYLLLPFLWNNWQHEASHRLILQNNRQQRPSPWQFLLFNWPSFCRHCHFLKITGAHRNQKGTEWKW